jgi:hypothetical protein
MDDNRLANIAKNGKPNTWTASRSLVRKLDMNITGEQAHWIKCRTRSCRKKKKKNYCNIIAHIYVQKSLYEGREIRRALRDFD